MPCNCFPRVPEGCRDIDWCLVTLTCRQHGTCVDGLHTYTRSCALGNHSVSASNGEFCVEVNECEAWWGAAACSPGTQVQATEACSLWQKGPVTPSGACQLSATKFLHAESKSRRLGIPQQQLFGQQMKVYGELMERGEVVFHSNVGDEGDDLAGPTVLRRPSRTRRRQGGGKPARPHRAGLS